MRIGTRSIWYIPAQDLFMFVLCSCFFCFLFSFSFILFLYIAFNSFIEIYFTYHTTHPLKVYNSVYLTIFGGLCNHYHLEYFCHPQRNPIPISNHSPFFPPLFQPRQQIIYFLCFKCMKQQEISVPSASQMVGIQ